jgi:hypothetical protein
MLDDLQPEITAGVTSTDGAPAEVLLDYLLYPPRKSRRLVVDVRDLPCADMVMLEHDLVTLEKRGSNFYFSFKTDKPVTVYFKAKGHTQ